MGRETGIPSRCQYYFVSFVSSNTLSSFLPQDHCVCCCSELEHSCGALVHGPAHQHLQQPENGTVQFFLGPANEKGSPRRQRLEQDRSTEIAASHSGKLQVIITNSRALNNKGTYHITSHNVDVMPPSKSSYVEVLTPRTSECDLIWK